MTPSTMNKPPVESGRVALTDAQYSIAEQISRKHSEARLEQVARVQSQAGHPVMKRILDSGMFRR